jgi:signal transduction histidine kinase
MGFDRVLFQELTNSVRDGHEAAVLAARVGGAGACVVMLPKRGAWTVGASTGVSLDKRRLRLQREDIEDWLAAASGRRPWSGVPVLHGDDEVAQVMVDARADSDQLRDLCSLAAPFLAARRWRGRTTELLSSTVAQLVHDLGQPIAALSMVHHAMAGTRSTDPVLLERARRSVTRLRELTGDLLLLASPHRRHTANVEMVPLLSELIGDYAERAHSLDVQLVLEAHAEVTLRASRLALLRAFGNVLGNAVEFAPAGTCVRIILDAADTVSIEVRDQGPGVPAGLRERVFTPFFTTRAGGNGLGLAVAHKVAQQHGGSVRIVDEPGGVVRFELPLSRMVHPKLRLLASHARPAII